MVNDLTVNDKLHRKHSNADKSPQMTLQFSANYVTMDYLDKYGTIDNDDISSVDSNVEVDCDVIEAEGSIDDLYKQLVTSNNLNNNNGNQVYGNFNFPG